jgi:CelD/BcsL family acetyltransferase involved in cellulose biosynthesis
MELHMQEPELVFDTAAGQPHTQETLRLPLAIGEVTLQAYRSLDGAEREWRAFERQASGHPYQHFHWLSAWHAQIRPNGVAPFIVMLRHRGRLAMLLPLAVERSFGISRLVPMGAPVCDYHCPLVDPEFGAQLTPEMVRTMLREVCALAEVDYMLLTHAPPMIGPARNPFCALPLHSFGASAYGTTLGGDWHTYYSKHRSARTRSRLRRKEAALAQHGPIVFGAVTDPDRRVALAAEIVRCKADRLRSTAGEFNTLARRDVQSFFSQLAGAAVDGDFFVFELTVGGRLAAAAIGLVSGGCFYYEVSAYPEEAFRRFSPGSLLLHRLMEWAIARGCTRFDFTVGDESYKAEWCEESWALGCGAWPRTMRGRLGASLAIGALWLVGNVKRHPALFWLAARCRTALGRLRRAMPAAPA